MAQYFNLTLDTTAPSGGSITVDNYYNTAGSVGLSAGQAGASFMKVWVSQSATGTTSDTNYPSGWEVYDTSKTVSFNSQGTNYVHAQFMDEVGNISSIVDSSATIYDNVAPSISAVSINSGDDYTNNTSVTVRVSVTDATSGVDYVTLSGDIVETGDSAKFTFNDTDRTNGYKDCSVTLTSTDATKTVSATATDRAGNTSTSSSDSIALDTTEASATLVLRNAGDTANLPSYVNDDDFAAAISTSDTDIVSYKIWGDIDGATSEPDNWTPATFTEGRMLIDNLTFTSTEGTKEVNVKIRDIGGNVTELTPASVVYDVTAPTVGLSADVSVISAQSGYNSVTFTYTGSDTNSMTNYQLKVDDSVIKQGSFTSGMTQTVTEAEIVAVSAGEGSKSFVLYVDDVAGNTGNSSAVSIAVDLTAPTGSVTASDYYNSSSISVTVSGSDTGGASMSKMKVWLDSSEPSSWENYSAGSYAMTGVAEGQHTAYIKLKDSVDNASSSISSSTFIVDTTAPTGTISTSAYTNTRSITINVSASDAKSGIEVSGVDKMKIWENGTTEPSEWETYAATKSITLTEGDGSKTINAKFKDAAGNETSSVAATCSTILDTDAPDVTLNLFKTDNSTALPAHVNVTGFTARIGFTNETQDSPIVAYQLTGDFTDSSEEWQTFTADSGQNYMTVSGLNLTSGDGLKTITAKLKDEAGNITSTAASASTTYDSAPPVIDVNAPDYNKVSKQHTLRRNTSTAAEISGKYNDVCTFTWSANEALQAFKVCVNAVGQTAAGATAIGTTNGSQNMSGGSVAANTDVTSVIFGADFAATDAVNDVDGAYEVIVYGQDLGGTWSAVHVLS